MLNFHRTTRHSEQIFIKWADGSADICCFVCRLTGRPYLEGKLSSFCFASFGERGPTMVTSALFLLQGDPSLVVRACTRSVPLLSKPLFIHSVALLLPSHLKVHALRSFARGIQLHLSCCVATCSASFVSASTQLRPYTFDYIERTDGQS